MNMKKFLIILLLTAFVACDPVVNVSVRNNFVTVIQSGFINASQVAGFDHQYDTVKMTVTNKDNNMQYFYERHDNKNYFTGIALGKGLYGFYIASIDSDDISPYMEFMAYNQNVVINAGSNDIILNNTESNQGLILVDRTTVEGVPTITVNGVTASMSTADNHYYSYVKNNAVVNYLIGGQESNMPIQFAKQKIILFAASQGDVSIDDPFIEVIII